MTTPSATQPALATFARTGCASPPPSLSLRSLGRFTRMNISHLTFGFALLLAGCGDHQVATGSPDYIPAHQCQANLKQIDGAKASWAQEHHRTTNDTPAWSDLVGRDRYLISQFACSKGGIYSLGRVGERARCTVAGHTL